MSVRSYYAFTPSSGQAFGARRGSGGRRHRGVERSTSTRPGNPVPALLGGRVIGTLSPAAWHGFGHQVTTDVTYNGRRYYVSYAHGSRATPLRVGRTFPAGTTVITEGTTGATSGSCVHVEVYDVALGKFIDPMTLIRAVVKTHQVSGGTTVAPLVTQEDDMTSTRSFITESSAAPKFELTPGRKRSISTAEWDALRALEGQAKKDTPADPAFRMVVAIVPKSTLDGIPGK